jgi:hypothetical protein
MKTPDDKILRAPMRSVLPPSAFLLISVRMLQPPARQDLLPNTITFLHSIGEGCVIKLGGPSKIAANVLHEQSSTAQVASGSYYILMATHDRGTTGIQRGNPFLWNKLEALIHNPNRALHDPQWQLLCSLIKPV